MSVYVDTSALYAVLDTGDRNHAAAAPVWLNLLERRVELVASNYVVVETCAILHRRLGAGAMRRLVADVLPALAVYWVDEAVHGEAMAAALGSSRSGPSLVDCVSFTLMRRLGLTDAFAFDAHFTDQGFGFPALCDASG